MNRIIYASRGGNTRRLAEAVAKGAGVPAVSVEDLNGLENTDLLFVGASIYAGSIDGSLRGFLRGLRSSQVKKAVVFGSSAGSKTALTEIKSILEPKGIPVADEEFHCRGAFLFVNRGRPDGNDLARAEAFAGKLCGEQK